MALYAKERLMYTMGPRANERHTYMCVILNLVCTAPLKTHPFRSHDGPLLAQLCSLTTKVCQPTGDNHAPAGAMALHIVAFKNLGKV